MNVAVICETSGKVREAFRSRGHNAVSVDVLPADDGSPYHVRADALAYLAERRTQNAERIDLVIAHPPCTYLANSGVQWLTNVPQNPNPNILYGPARVAALHEAAEFFLAIWRCRAKAVAIENPIMHDKAMALIGMEPTQIIQPFMFGHRESKATCLWLRGLRALEPTNYLPPPYEQRIWKEGPSADRRKIRSETYQGIADAMAEQWGAETRPDLLF